MSVANALTVSPRVRHYAVVILVFGLTGSLFVAVLALAVAVLSRVLLNGLLGMDGSLWAGGWGYRAAYLALIPPSYSVMLVAIGTLFGKHHYFRRRALRVWGWLPGLRRFKTH